MDSLDFESRLSEMDESSLSNPPSDSDSSDSSRSDNEAGRERKGDEGDDDDEEEEDDDQDNDDDGAGGQDQTPNQQIEWLATTRSRRSNAGNRMKSMLANEEPDNIDSDLELLFAEDENDIGFFEADEHESDVQMDSSSEDEDEADDTNAGDDLAGEKELERQAREKRAAQRKRKAQSAIPAKFRKRVRIDATASETSTPAPRPRPAPAFAPRPRKKSERLSWLPSPADLPTRASSRETTRISKEQLHQQMVEREEKRHKQLVQMQKKAARMEALKKPPMTQEDRLREAAIVEERNSKSLNRWEVAERQREEDRRIKLAALHQRTLRGPVITLWSGIGEARRAMVEEEKPKKKRERADKTKNKATDIQKQEHGKESLSSVAGQDGQDAKQDTDSGPLKPPQLGLASPLPDSTPAAAATAPSTATSEIKEVNLPLRQDTAETHQDDERTQSQSPAAEKGRQRLMAMPSGPPPPSPSLQRTGYAHLHDKSGKPSGVLAAPVLAPPPSMNVAFDPNQTPKSNVLALPNTSQLVTRPGLPPIQVQSQEASSYKPPTTTARFLPPEGEVQDKKNEAPAPESTAEDAHRSEPTSQLATETSADVATTTTRNAIIFQNFDETAIMDKSIQTQILFGQTMNKLSKPPPGSICAVTNLPARYRDPKTGLAYYNTHAYREIQRLSRGEHRWSKILNAWVGSGSVAARGVPERFLNPNAPPPPPPPGRAAASDEKKKAQAATKSDEGAESQQTVQAKRSVDSPKSTTKLAGDAGAEENTGKSAPTD